MSKNVKTLLLLNSSEVKFSFSLLFHVMLFPLFSKSCFSFCHSFCARYCALQGRRVLFISKTPIKSLPYMIGKIDSFLNPDVIRLIQFMYLTTWQDLLEQLYTIHLRHFPVSVIIVENLEYYLKSESEVESHASLICASLLYAASVCSRITSKQVILINDYICQESTIEKNVVKSFFHNIWEVKPGEENGITKIDLFETSAFRPGETIKYSFRENLEDSTLSFMEVVKKITST